MMDAVILIQFSTRLTINSMVSPLDQRSLSKSKKEFVKGTKMVIDSYVDQIFNSVKFQDEAIAREQIALIMQAFAESVEDTYGIRIADRHLKIESVASPKRTRR